MGKPKSMFGDVDADDDRRDDEFEDDKARMLLQSTKQYAPSLLPREALQVPEEIGQGRFQLDLDAAVDGRGRHRPPYTRAVHRSRSLGAAWSDSLSGLVEELRGAARSGSHSAAADLTCLRALRSRDLVRVALAEEAAVHGSVAATTAELLDFGYGSASLWTHVYRGPFFSLYLQSIVAAI